MTNISHVVKQFEQREEQQKKAVLDTTPPAIMQYWRLLAKKHNGVIKVRRIPRNGYLVFLSGDKHIDLAWAPLGSKLTQFFINDRSREESVALKMLKLKAFW